MKAGIRLFFILFNLCMVMPIVGMASGKDVPRNTSPVLQEIVCTQADCKETVNPSVKKTSMCGACAQCCVKGGKCCARCSSKTIKVTTTVGGAISLLVGVGTFLSSYYGYRATHGHDDAGASSLISSLFNA